MIHLIALRLTRGMDLKQQIVQLVQQHRIHAGSIASCVGCLSTLHIRLADSVSTLQVSAPFEILSLSGTLTYQHCHLHIAVADAQACLGGICSREPYQYHGRIDDPSLSAAPLYTRV